MNVCASPGEASSVLVVSPGLLSSLKQWLPDFCFHSGHPLCGRSQEPANCGETGPRGLGTAEPGRLARLGSGPVCAERPSSAAATETVQPVEPRLYLLLVLSRSQLACGIPPPGMAVEHPELQGPSCLPRRGAPRVASPTVSLTVAQPGHPTAFRASHDPHV